MNINNFENHINKTILDRGYVYYSEGNITETYNKGENEYIFQVQGSEDYEVVVKINNNGEILYSDCDCPYDFGPICKHQVAAYFELFDILNSEDNCEGMKKEVIKQPEIEKVLDNLSKEELINIIVDITKKDNTLKNSIIFRYSKVDERQEIEKCKKFIDSIVRKYRGRESFITYREVDNFIREMEELLEKVKNTDNILLALDIAFLALDEGMETFQYTDDSDGGIGNFVSETIYLIGETIANSKNLDINQKKEIFNKLLNKSDSKVFDGWEDYKIDMLRICAEFINVEEFRNKLREKLECIINENSGDYYVEYTNESILKILFHMINEYGTKEEAEEFIEDNLKFTYFREMLINKCVEEKNYHKVIELALEGEKQDEQYAGLVSKWKKIRYIAYKELLLKEEQEKLAKDLLFDGNFEYYKELKALVTGDKEVFYNKLKQELKNYNSWKGRGIYLKLIIEENDLDEIMEFVRKNPKNIEEYADILVDKFEDEVVEIYKNYIKSEAESSSCRSHYKGVCRILRKYEKIAGKESQKRVLNELSSLYRRRPAFLDELSKIK